MDESGTLVDTLILRNETAVPLSIFCLQNLRYLDISGMTFPDGNSSLSTNT